MNDSAADVIVNRIAKTHGWILQAAEKLTEGELCHVFGSTAPPIGWHLWHITRWADRVQASLSELDDSANKLHDPNDGIWEREQLALQWDLDPTTLGTLEEGSGMDFAVAATLPQRIGREALMEYARRVFAKPMRSWRACLMIALPKAGRA